MIIAISGYAGSGKDLVGQMIQYHTSECSKPKMSNSRYRTFDEFVKAGGGSDLRDFDHHYYTEWEIKKFAGKLKEIASILLGVPKHKFEDQEFKKQFLGSQWETYGIVRDGGTRQIAVKTTPHDPNGMWLQQSGNTEMHNRMTGREFLQKLGTDALRDKLHPNVWINALFADYTTDMSGYSDRMSGADIEDLYPNWIITDCRFSNEALAVKDHGGIIVRINRPGIDAVNAHPSETGLDTWAFDHVITNEGSKEELLAKVATMLDSVLVTH
jgi:hypothetical protein